MRTTLYFQWMCGFRIYKIFSHFGPHLSLTTCYQLGKVSIPLSQNAWVWIWGHLLLAQCSWASYFNSLPWFPHLGRDCPSAYLMGDVIKLKCMCKAFRSVWNTVSKCSIIILMIIISIILEMWELRLGKLNGFPKSLTSGQAGCRSQGSWLTILVVVKWSACKNWCLAIRPGHSAAKTK